MLEKFLTLSIWRRVVDLGSVKGDPLSVFGPSLEGEC